jgi:hypothetical protein
MARTRKAEKPTPAVAEATPEHAPVTTPAVGEAPVSEAAGEHFGRSMSLRDVIDVPEGEQGQKPAAEAASGVAAEMPR